MCTGLINRFSDRRDIRLILLFSLSLRQRLYSRSYIVICLCVVNVFLITTAVRGQITTVTVASVGMP